MQETLKKMTTPANQACLTKAKCRPRPEREPPSNPVRQLRLPVATVDLRDAAYHKHRNPADGLGSARSLGFISSEVLAPFASAHSNIKCLKVGDLEIYVSFVIYDGSKVVGNLADLIRCSNTMKENWVDSANLKRDLSTFCNIFHLQRY